MKAGATQCEERALASDELMQSGVGGNSFSPLTPFPCRRRSWCNSVIFDKISSSNLVQWLQSPSGRGGAQRRPLIYLFATGFLVGKKKESRKILNFTNTFLRKTPLAIFSPPMAETLPKHESEFLLLNFLLAV